MRNRVINNIKPESKTTDLPVLIKDLKYFWLSMSAILLSLFFPVAEYQFLTIAVITGMKWISDNKNSRIIIIERR